MADGAVIGSLVVRIGADAKELLGELKKADSGFGTFGRSVKTAHDAVAAFSGAAVAVAGTLAAVIAKSAGTAEEMHKMAQSAGMATGTFSEYAFVARLANISTEQLGQSIGKLNRSMVEAADGTGDSARAFKALGVEVTNADGSMKSADEVLAAVADRFKEFPDGPQKSAAAMMIFGKSGASMIPMLNQGAAAIQQLREEARALGVTIDSETGKAAEEFRDNLSKLGQVGVGAANSLMKELLPALNQVTGELVAAGIASGGFAKEAKTLADFIQGSVLTVFQTLGVVGSDVAFVFRMVGGELGVIAAQMGALMNLDFAGAKLIGEEWTRDAAQARKDLDEFQAKLLGLKKVTADAAGGGAMDMGVGLEQVFAKRNKAIEIQTQAEIEAEKKRNEEIRAIRFKVNEENDKRDLEQIALQNKARAEAEAVFQQQQLELRVMFEDREVEMGQARLARMRLLKTFEFKGAEQMANEAHAARIAQLQVFTDEELAQLGGRQAVIERLENEHSQRKLAIVRQEIGTRAQWEAASFAQRSATLIGQFASLTSQMQNQSRRHFEMYKAAAIANAIVSAWEGIAKTLGSVPFPWNIPLVAAHAALAWATVSNIRSSSFGGGGGGGSLPSGGGGGVGGGGSTPGIISMPANTTTGVGLQPAPPVSGGGGGVDNGGGSAKPSTSIILNGTSFGQKQIRDLVARINEAHENGGRVSVAG